MGVGGGGTPTKPKVINLQTDKIERRFLLYKPGGALGGGGGFGGGERGGGEGVFTARHSHTHWGGGGGGHPWVLGGGA